MEIETSGLEVLLKEIPYNEISIGYGTEKKHYYDEWSMELLCRYGRRLFPSYNADEINNVFQYLKSFNCRRDEKNNIFELIRSVSNEVLSKEKTIQYKYESTLRWRNLSLYIGADIFVASHIAEVKNRKQRLQRIYNCWRPCITVEEEYRIKESLAENHFHLIGSTRIFELNWIAVMNYVLDRESDFNKIIEYRKSIYVFSEQQNIKVSLWEKTCIAALYRLYLFCVINQYELRDQCEKMIIAIENNEQMESFIPQLDQMIENVRICYCNNELGKIDYAILKEVFESNVDSAYGETKNSDDEIVVSPQTESWVALAGERTFLVECLSKIYSSGEFNDFDKNIFYRYLVIKNNFRDELIQVNKEIGFYNFSEYQKRKTYFVKNRSFYVNEIGRLALCATVDSQNLDSFEARIMVAEKDYLFNSIKRYNNIFYNRKNAMGKEEVDLFYVLHFPKQKEASIVKFESRNYILRKNVEKKARELVNFLMQHPEYVYFVRGIDTCSNEIGCRPEVFAVIYRQLMNYPFKGYRQIWQSDRLSGEILNNSKKQVCENILEEYDCYLQATYHVGEEFIDIVDGLRAIEEAVLFCNLKRGCRLGHALALGIDPKTYYKFKKSEMVLPRQDLLDNLMWLYFKGKKYRMDKIERFQQLFEVLLKEILEHLQYIYGDNVAVDEINKYYFAWMLRGDNPDMYRTVQCIDIEKYRGTPFEYNYNYRVDQVEISATLDNSNNMVKNKNEQLLYSHIREDEDIIRWYHRYHYDVEAREKGRECCKYKIPRGYASLVQLIQDEIMKEIQELGITIECNPSSNCLIGTFDRYDEHPIVRFNSQSLQPSPYSHRLTVSINTDDQGVFDTSLENEYYFVKVALDKAIDQDEQKVYFNEEEWIVNIIKMGHEQAFTFDKMIGN